MPKLAPTIESDDLIELVQENHKVVLEKFQKSEEENAETKAAFTALEQKMIARKGGAFGADENKTVGDQIVGSEEFKTFVANGARTQARIEVKAVGTIGSGAALAGPLIAP